MGEVSEVASWRFPMHVANLSRERELSYVMPFDGIKKSPEIRYVIFLCPMVCLGGDDLAPSLNHKGYGLAWADKFCYHLRGQKWRHHSSASLPYHQTTQDLACQMPCLEWLCLAFVGVCQRLSFCCQSPPRGLQCNTDGCTSRKWPMEKEKMSIAQECLSKFWGDL